MIESSKTNARKFESEFTGTVPWGTHFCQLYETKQDLIDILVPYFVEGLRRNEFCMWVTSPPLEAAEAKEALGEAVPDLEECLSKGQIEIISYKDWYLQGGRFDSDHVLEGWVEKEIAAMKNGFEGLRLTGNTFWIERSLWNSFVDYEAAVNAVIGKHRMIALCTYCLSDCSGNDVIDVVSNHTGTLIKQSGKWVLVEDALQRKKAEEALKKTNEELEERVRKRTAEVTIERQRLFSVLETLPAMICLLTPDYHVAFANRGFREKFGESKDGHCYEYCFGMTAPCAFCESYGVLKTGKPHQWECKTPDGSIIDAYAFPFADVDGSPMILEMDLDVTQQKRNDAELRKSLGTIRAQAELLDSANEAILVTDAECRIVYWNKGAEKIYGWTNEEAVGKKIHDLLQNDPLIIAEATTSLKSTGQWSGELKHITKDGRAIVVESHWTIVSDDAKKPLSIMEINTDITETKKLEEQYLRAQRLESLGTLAGGIAHDFRNILTPVMITLGLIDQHLTKKEEHEMIAALQKNLRRGADLSNQLLAFARGTTGERTSISAHALIFDVEKTIRETFPRSIRIETKADPALPVFMGDATQLHQVLINMCINARDAMPFGGTLSLTAENAFIDLCYARLHPDAKVGPHIIISVIDTGTGMPPEVLDRLFEPFFTTKKPGEGTGLGLATSRSIVKRHGGFINVYSEVGKGTTFKIYLPMREANGAQQESFGTGEFHQGSGQTILVVDDEELIRITTIAALENNGYKALGAGDGAEALGVYVKHEDEIKAILVDMAMPILDGEATIRALKKISPEAKIIGMSGLAENEKYKAMYNITNAFITKPFTAEKLLNTVFAVVSGKNIDTRLA